MGVQCVSGGASDAVAVPRLTRVLLQSLAWLVLIFSLSRNRRLALFSFSSHSRGSLG